MSGDSPSDATGAPAAEEVAGAPARAPRRRRRYGALAAVPMLLLAAYTTVWATWNDARLGRSVSHWSSVAARGAGGPTHEALVYGSIHYPYWCTLGSLVTRAACPVAIRDVHMYDPDGAEILSVARVDADVEIGELVQAVAVGLGRDIRVHVTDGRIDGARAAIHLTRDRREVNIVSAVSPRPGLPPGKPVTLLFDVEKLHFHDVDFSLGFPGWEGHLDSADGDARVRYSSAPDENRDPTNPAFTFALTNTTAATGTLRLGETGPQFVFPLENLSLAKYASDAKDHGRVDFDVRVKSKGACTHEPCRVAQLHIPGFLYGIFGKAPGADLGIDLVDGEGLMAMLRLDLLGGNPNGHIKIHGPFTDTVIEGEVHDAAVHVAGLTVAPASAYIKLRGATLAVTDIDARLGKGTVGGTTHVYFDKLAWESDLTTRGVDPGVLQPLVPVASRRVMAGKLDSKAHLYGSFASAEAASHVHVRGIKGTLARTTFARDPIPHVVELGGGVDLSPTRIGLVGTTLRTGGVTARAEGDVDLPPEGRPATEATAHATLVVEAERLREGLMSRLGLRGVASGGSLHATLSGGVMNPTVDGKLAVKDVGAADLRLPEVDAHLRFSGGKLALDGLHGEGAVGNVAGKAEVSLFDGSFLRAIADPRIRAELGLDRLHLHVITGIDGLHGTVAGTVALSGTAKHPRGTIDLGLPQLLLYGDAYEHGELHASLADDGLHIDQVAVVRHKEPGAEESATLLGAGRLGWHGELDGTVSAVHFPVEAIPQLRDVKDMLAGTLSGTVRVTGDVHHPVPSGSIEVQDFRVRKFELGSGKLDIEPVAGQDGVIHLGGVFFDRFRVDGTMRLWPTLSVTVALAFDDFRLEDLVPEMKDLAEIKGIASGKALFFFGDGGPTRAELHLTKLVLDVGEGPDEDADEERHSEQFRNEGELVISVDFDHLRLAFPQLYLRSRGGELQITGTAEPAKLDVHVVGKLQLQFLEYFTSSLTGGRITHTHGKATADLALTGTARKPVMQGTLDLADAEIKPLGADRPFVVHHGRIAFDVDGIHLYDLAMELDDAKTSAQGFLEVTDWNGPKLGRIALDVSGQLSPTLGEWLLPDQIGETSGVLGIDAHVRGTVKDPSWSGRVDLKDVALRAKRLGRDVHFTGGTLILQDWNLTVGCPDGPDGTCRTVSAKIDETGDLALDGSLGLKGLGLSRIDLHMQGDNLDWGRAGVYTITLQPNVELTGSGTHLSLAGTVNIVSGAYTQPFDALKTMVLQPRVEEQEEPFYKGIPALESLGLALSIQASGPLTIKNNLADMQLTMSRLDIGGTLADMTMDGTVEVEEGGTFNVPILRGQFQTDKGSIHFERDKNFPKTTPYLEINASQDFQDRYEQTHHILLNITGSFGSPHIALSSTDGMDQGQVLAMLFTGAPTDQFRQSLQNDPTAKQGSGANGLIQSGSGALLSDTVENPLKAATGFAVVRIEIGYFKVCPVSSRYVKLCGTGEGQLSPTSRYNMSLDLRMSDDVSLSSSFEYLEHGVDTSENIVDRFRLQLKLRYPILR